MASCEESERLEFMNDPIKYMIAAGAIAGVSMAAGVVGWTMT